jgi:hypothetical protein
MVQQTDFYKESIKNYKCCSNVCNKKVNKGAWRMPWLLEAMKDVISCDKLRGLANTN